MEPNVRTRVPPVSVTAPASRFAPQWDAYGLIASAAALVAVAWWPHVPDVLRLAVGSVVVVFAPGYAWTEALWPQHAARDGIERLGFSLLGSLVWAIVWPVILAAWGWPFDRHFAAIGEAGSVLAGALVVLWRRSRLDANAQHRLTVPALPHVLLGLASLTLVGGSVAVAWANVTRQDLAFSVTSRQGLLMNYPYQVIAGQHAMVTLHLSNLDPATAYAVVILDGSRPWRTLTVRHRGSTWTRTVTLPSSQNPSSVHVVFRLMEERKAKPLRTLWLTYQVVP
jgi:uncharacterized membrane protein